MTLSLRFLPRAHSLERVRGGLIAGQLCQLGNQAYRFEGKANRVRTVYRICQRSLTPHYGRPVAPALDGSSCQFRHIRFRLAFFGGITVSSPARFSASSRTQWSDGETFCYANIFLPNNS